MPCDDVVIVDSFSSPFCVVFLPPEGVVGLVHEHAVLKEHDIQEPPVEEEQGKHEEELPVGPGEGRDERCDNEQVEQRALRLCVEHFCFACTCDRILIIIKNN